VHRRLIFSFPERDRIPHVTLVVQGKFPPGSRSVWSLGPRPPERRPIRCRCQVSSPAPSLRFLARLLLLHTVSKNPCSISLSLVHLAPPRARRSSRATPFRCRPPTRHDCPP
jgi:hypothetical protein